MRILAVGCHPDDIKVSCAGTLARYAREGHTVILCHLCNGNLGHVIIEPEALREIRAQEAKEAGELAHWGGGFKQRYPGPEGVYGWITPIYYMDTLAGAGFKPGEYVDITETIAMKLQMLVKHEFGAPLPGIPERCKVCGSVPSVHGMAPDREKRYLP